VSDTKWPTATRERPCPECGKPNRCLVAPDGGAWICWRSGSSEVKRDRAHPNGNGQHRRHDPPPAATKPKPTYVNAEEAIEAARKQVEWSTKQTATLAGVWLYPGDMARVARFNLADGSKEFRPLRHVETGWQIGDPPGRWAPYRGDELPAAESVWITEGEKCADRLRDLGLPGITSAHGSNAAAKTDWTALAARDVVILPDNDEAGRKYAQDVVKILSHLDAPARVKIVALPDLAPGGDIIDFDATFAAEPETTRAEIERLAEAVPWMDAPVPAPRATAEPDDSSIEPIAPHAVSIRVSDVKQRDVEWLWQWRIALGKLTLLFGDPGLGKSLLTLFIAAIVTCGGSWPDGGDPAPIGDVLILSAEDALEDTIAPRLDRAGANTKKVIAVRAIRWRDAKGKSRERSVTLDDTEILDDMMAVNPGVKLVIVDPVTAYLGNDTDSHKNSDVRALLAGLSRLAEKYNVAVVVVSHMNKGGGGHAIYRATGSLAFVAAARAAWLIERDKADPARRLFLQVKNNLAPEQSGLAFTMTDGRIVFEDAPVFTRADDALADEPPATPGPKPEARNAACEWLQGLLAGGPIPVGDEKKPEAGTIRAEAQEAALSWATVRRAADALGIKSERCQFTGKYQWRLLKLVAQEPLPSHNLSNLSNLQKSGVNDAVLPLSEGGCSSSGNMSNQSPAQREIDSALEALEGVA
jgi:hypothetical protein